MKIGVVFPQTEFGSDPVAVRDYAQAAEDLGYTHVIAYDHVLGADPAGRKDWGRRYTHRDAFLEPFALFSFMAAATTRLGFCTSILILPQRQTALVAKQAATLDVLSGGRLRLGVGVGWNAVEYEALGEDFHTRGRRIEEQAGLLRRLWTEPLVTFRGRWDTVVAAGLNPLPVQRPIPLWFGGHADPVLRRTARQGNGWMPTWRTPAEAQPDLDRLFAYLAEAGRSRAEFGVEARIPYAEADVARWSQLLEGWQVIGATHASVNTMGAGLVTPQAHLDALRLFAEAAALRGSA
jgi:probable F420-dependent oxidoreductase